MSRLSVLVRLIWCSLKCSCGVFGSGVGVIIFERFLLSVMMFGLMGFLVVFDFFSFVCFCECVGVRRFCCCGF